MSDYLNEFVDDVFISDAMRKMSKKTANMKPIPPWDDLRDGLWEKVDILIKKNLDLLVKNKKKEPLKILSTSFVRWSFDDTDKGVQTVALRLMESYGLIEIYKYLIDYYKKEEFFLEEIKIPQWVILPDEWKDLLNDVAGGRRLLSVVRKELINRRLINQKRK